MPMLAPSTIGTACCKVRFPEATIATTLAVTVELLWIKAVTSKPINRLMNGFLVALRMSNAIPPLIFPTPTVSRSMAKMKSSKAKKTCAYCNKLPLAGPPCVSKFSIFRSDGDNSLRLSNGSSLNPFFQTRNAHKN